MAHANPLCFQFILQDLGKESEFFCYQRQKKKNIFKTCLDLVVATDFDQKAITRCFHFFAYQRSKTETFSNYNCHLNTALLTKT